MNINPVNVKSSQERLKSHETTELNGRWPLDFCSKTGRKTGKLAHVEYQHGRSPKDNVRLRCKSTNNLQFFDICITESQFCVQVVPIFLVSFTCFACLWCF